MAKGVIVDKVRRALKAFGSAEGGNVLMLFGLSIIPLVGLVGVAADYSRASAARTELQAALDATTLMLSKEATGLDSDQLNAKANAYFKAMYNRSDVSNLVVTANYTTDNGSRLNVTASGTLQNDFVTVLGIDTTDIGSSSTSTWGMGRMRVALVLDNSTSMNDDGKMPALISAANSLLAKLKSGASKPEDVYVSIIPFSKDVSVDVSNVDATWLDWTDWDAKYGETKGTCSNSDLTTKSACVTTNTWEQGCSKSRYTTKSKCQSNRGTWGYYCSNRTLTSQSACEAKNTWTRTWNGCLTDRDKDYDTTADAPVPGSEGVEPSTLFPVEDDKNPLCPVALMGLTNDWTALGNKINAMKPNGYTNQTIGLQWGFQSLVTNNPLPVPEKDPKYDYQDVIVLMTDGLNTWNRFTDLRTPHNPDVDPRTEKACQNIRDAGITMYVLQVSTDADPESQLLKDCATTYDKFYLAKSSSEMIAAFNAIGSQLSQLRLAQ